MTSMFELRLLGLGECVNQLATQAQHLQNIFNVCLQDYQNSLNPLTSVNPSTEEHIFTPPSQTLKFPVKSDINAELGTEIGTEIGTEYENITNNTNIISNINIYEQPKEETNINQINANNRINQRMPPQKRLNPEEQMEDSTIAQYIPNDEEIEDLNRILVQEDMNTTTNIEELDIIDQELESNTNTNNTANSTYTPNNIYTPRMTKNRHYKTKFNERYHPKKYESMYSVLTTSEKNRMVYDLVELGATKCDRKWGLHNSMLFKYAKKVGLFTTNQEKYKWMLNQKKIIERKMSTLDLKTVTKNIVDILQNNDLNKKINMDLNELHILSFDRGIAVAAIRHFLPLYDLEFLLRKCAQWEVMEINDWFNITVDVTTLTKIDILNSARREGTQYTSKKTGVSRDLVNKIKSAYSRYGLGGLEAITLDRNVWKDKQKSHLDKFK